MHVNRGWVQYLDVGITKNEAKQKMLIPNYFACMMVQCGFADGVISGLTSHYPDTIRPALQVIGTRRDIKNVSGMYIVFAKKGTYFFSDTTVNIQPDAETLAEIALQTAETVQRFSIEPKIAMLSFSNFGSVQHPEAQKVPVVIVKDFFDFKVEKKA